MTAALCLWCGAVHFGSLLPCSACGRTADDDHLAFALSDHYVAGRSLPALGRLIAELGRALPPRDARTALAYLCAHAYPDALPLGCTDEDVAEAKAALGGRTFALPAIELADGRVVAPADLEAEEKRQAGVRAAERAARARIDAAIEACRAAIAVAAAEPEAAISGMPLVPRPRRARAPDAPSSRPGSSIDPSEFLELLARVLDEAASGSPGNHPQLLDALQRLASAAVECAWASAGPGSAASAVLERVHDAVTRFSAFREDFGQLAADLRALDPAGARPPPGGG